MQGLCCFGDPRVRVSRGGDVQPGSCTADQSGRGEGLADNKDPMWRQRRTSVCTVGGWPPHGMV